MGRKDRSNPRRADASALAEQPSGNRVDLEAPPVETIGKVSPVDAPPDPLRAARRFRIAAVVAALWIIALAALAWSTANPVTFNREQLKHAQLVLTGTVIGRAEGRVTVEKEWKHADRPRGEPLVLDNLSRTEARDGRRYLIPVSRRPDGTLIVTETRLPNGRPLIYPATPESEAELSDLLRTLQP